MLKRINRFVMVDATSTLGEAARSRGAECSPGFSSLNLHTVTYDTDYS